MNVSPASINFTLVSLLDFAFSWLYSWEYCLSAVGVHPFESQGFQVIERNADTSYLTVVTNPDDPNFDIEKLLAKWEKEHQ